MQLAHIIVNNSLGVCRYTLSRVTHKILICKFQNDDEEYDTSGNFEFNYD